jgi:hypothetical protein
MAGGTTDTLNLTLATGFVDTSGITNTENLNLIVGAGVDINLGANGTTNGVNAIDAATTVTITGGNSLSTFEIGDSAAASGDNIDAAVDIDASGFNGNIFVEFDSDILTATTDVDAGALTTDEVLVLENTTMAAAIILPFTGVETVTFDLDTGNNGAEQYTYDVDTATGLTTLAAASGTTGNTLLDIDDYVSTITVQLGGTISGTIQEFGNSSEVDINPLSATGTADVVNVSLLDTDDGTGTIDIDSAGVETINIAVTATGSQDHQISLAGVTATTGSNVAVNLTGGDSTGELVTIADMSTTTNVLNAAGFNSNITMTDRGSSTMTITGGDGNDSLRMENANDVITAGAGTDTLVVVQNAIIGGFLVDLSSSTDQLGTYNGAANTSAQTGFENVDLSNITGSNGADITAQSGSTTSTIMTGTINADNITLGTGDDTVTFNLATTNGNDAITGFTVGGTVDDMEVSAVDANFDATLEVATLSANGITLTNLGGGASATDVDVVILLDTTNLTSATDARTEGNGTAGAITDADGAIYVFYNTTTTDVEMWHNSDESAAGGTMTQIASLEGLGTADVANLVFADFI